MKQLLSVFSLFLPTAFADTSCPATQYLDGTTCANCNGGQYQPNAGFTGGSCTECSPGYYNGWSPNNQANCQECGADNRWSSSSKVQCDTCPSGSWTSGGGSSTRQSCQVCNTATRQYNCDGSSTKTLSACPSGHRMSGQDCVQCQQGEYLMGQVSMCTGRRKIDKLAPNNTNMYCLGPCAKIPRCTCTASPFLHVRTYVRTYVPLSQLLHRPPASLPSTVGEPHRVR